MTHKALVTGENRSIGRAIGARLVREGLDIVIGARDLAAGQEAPREIGAAAVALDLTNPEDGDSAIADITVLINNAGFLWDGNVFDDMGRFEATMDDVLQLSLLRLAIRPRLAVDTDLAIRVMSPRT